MNIDLTAAEIASYRDNGFPIIPNFLSEQELIDEQISRLKFGDLLENETRNPLIYHANRPYVSYTTV